MSQNSKQTTLTLSDADKFLIRECIIFIDSRLLNVIYWRLLRYIRLILHIFITLQVRYPTKKKFLYCLVCCSLSFFLFSFQVHEKSILIVSLPVMLVVFDSPLVSLWLLCVSTVSMYPLLMRDGQSVSYFALLAIFILLIYNFVDIWTYCWLIKLNVILSLIVAVGLHLAWALIPPPASLPDLYPLLFAVYSCGYFGIFWLYYNYMMWNKPSEDLPLEKIFWRFRAKDPLKAT